jgi:telomerase protein component 1
LTQGPAKLARVFVSSTFQDMHHERDILTRAIFPRLRERFQIHDVALFEVDLRWGITRELAESRGTLRLCLDEVDACRPLFFCMLGEYYGTSASAQEMQTLNAAWITALGYSTPPSMTELEIRQALVTPRTHGIDPVFFIRERSLSERIGAPASRSEAMTALKAFVLRIVIQPEYRVGVKRETTVVVTAYARIRMNDLVER